MSRWVRAAAALFVLPLVGCTSANSEPAIDIASVQLHPSAGNDLWLSDDYARGFGERWELENANQRICGIADGVAMVDTGNNKDVVGIRMKDRRQLWKIDGGWCHSRDAGGDERVIGVLDHSGVETRLLRVDIASGDSVELMASNSNHHHLFLETVALTSDQSFVVSDEVLFAFDQNGEEQWDIRVDTNHPHCNLIDGGEDLTDGQLPDSARIVCSPDGSTFDVIDPATGELLAELPISDDSRYLQARDGFVLATRSQPGTANELRRLDLAGQEVGDTSAVRAPSVPERMWLSRQELETYSAAGIDAISGTGRAVTVHDSEPGVIGLASGAPLREYFDVILVSHGGSVVVIGSYSEKQAYLVDAATGEELEDWTGSPDELRVMDGLLVNPGGAGAGRGFVVLPAD